ncbi:MAG TPA: histidine kinase dimerization/phospho-acceptor domain-containing protein, partial [Pirellulales bacterium]|nr:histidine kinase dimerization/phospho-acceptor domain-containing protein [Pirellulales bacterium]
MPKRHLRWHLFPFFAAIAFFSALAVGWFIASRFEVAGLSLKRGELSALAAFLDSQRGAAPTKSQQGFARLAADFSRASNVRIALLAPSLAVVFDTSGHPEELEKQTARAEIREALAGTAATEVRYNPALDQRVMYFAAPVMREGRPVGLLYLSTPLVALDEALGRLRSQAVVLAALTVVLATALAWWAARGIARPLEVVRRAADALGAGQWNTRVALPEPLELAELADSFNRLAEAWQRRVAVLIQNNNELKAVLASMAEGVLAVDCQEHLISMNTSCGRLLSIDPVHAQGRRLREVVRNADLSRFVIRSLACADGVEADVLLHGDRGRVIEAQGSALHDLDGRTIGAVVVLNDVTDFRRLEQIRRDFVANVSHELKTPITSIKGFVETLLDGAIRDPVDSERFLQIVAKQADRLHAIIEDLLSLSKIEQSEDANNLEL